VIFLGFFFIFAGCYFPHCPTTYSSKTSSAGRLSPICLSIDYQNSEHRNGGTGMCCFVPKCF